MPESYDFAVIGAGIAGAGVAAHLCDSGSVVVLEMESQPGYHTTGRSAAMFEPSYGPAPIRALSRASEAFYRAPPEGFCDGPLLSPRDVLMIARDDQMGHMQAHLDELSGEAVLEMLEGPALKARVPLIRDGYAAAGALGRHASAIDVNALHQGFLRQGRAGGQVLSLRAQVQGMRRQDGLWHLDLGGSSVQARVVINAAGAWADQIGQMAGAERIGLVPKRRTAMLIEAPEGVDVEALPLVCDIEEAFYLKPDAGRLLISPANEDAMDPCDAQPEELDIAICIDRIETAFDLQVRRIESRWAGLRSFVADKAPVVGFSARAEGFFWLAGQGGYGIQTAPALSRYAAALARGEAPLADVLDHGLDPDSLRPDRAALVG